MPSQPAALAISNTLAFDRIFALVPTPTLYAFG